MRWFFWFPLSFRFSLIGYLLGLIICTSSYAGVLELVNGDRLEGELVRVDGDQLIWKSTNFGEQSVLRAKIKHMETTQSLKINGNSEPCYLLYLENDTLSYRCGDNMEILGAPFLSLQVVEPFEDYKKNLWTVHGKINFWGSYARGNEVHDERSAQMETELRRGEWRHMLGADYSSASWGGSIPQVRWSAHYSLDWFFRERWFWYNNLVEGEDQRRGLKQYTLVGSGAGYQFWENKKSALSLAAGVAYLDENYLPPSNNNPADYVHGNSFGALRTALNLRYTLPFGVTLFHRNELIYSFEDSANWRLKTASGLSSMILNRIYAEFKWDYWLDNEPQPGRKAEDSSMSLGVSYKW